MPGTCTFGGSSTATSYACVNMSGTAPNRLVSGFVAKGNFLNWLSASKLDIQKKVLTGGKYDSFNDMLISESRGCVGRRFIKKVPALGAITFATRGPYSYEADNTSQSTRGGETRIEIYDASYNTTDCLAALNDWQTGAVLGTTQTDTKNCLGSGTNADVTATYNQIMHDCYWYYDGHGLSNLNSLEVDCAKLYNNYYGNDPANIINSTAGDVVCSSVMNHPLFNSNTKGFLGRCWSSSSGWDDTCALQENQDYCNAIAGYNATDPSAPTIASSDQPVPPFVIDAGVNALGKVAGTFFAHVALSTPPTGIIQDFKNIINFGTMVFNTDGSGSECNVSGTMIKCTRVCSSTSTRECAIDSDCPSGESCLPIPLRDGGRIISYLNYDPVGDHNSGMVKAIDDITATSWTPFGEAYYEAIGYFANRSDMRFLSEDYDLTKKPSLYRCQSNYILLVSDGMSTADQRSAVLSLSSSWSSSAGTAHTTCSKYAGSTALQNLAWFAKNKKITDGAASTANAANENEKITTYVVYTGPTSTSTDACDAENLMEKTAINGGTTAYKPTDYASFYNAIKGIFQAISNQTSSGTAASILSNSEGSGATMLQAVFYPRKSFDGNATTATWIGEMQNLWYFVDPYLRNSTVRDDYSYGRTTLATGDTHTLDLRNNRISVFKFNDVTRQVDVQLFNDANADSIADTIAPVSTISPDDLQSIWRAGKKLWARDLSTAPRTIYTTTDLGNFTSFNTTNKATLRPLLNVDTNTDAENLINYIHGIDQTGMRSRTISIAGLSNVWKLGDIISSTPRVQSSVPLNSYHLAPPSAYNDRTYGNYLNSPPTGYIYTSDYANRGMAYVGANDGMLHAFKLGILDVTSSGDIKAKLTGSNLGEEQWAFIPKNALPYLKFLSDPTYIHTYYVDGTPVLADLSVYKDASCTGDYWNCYKAPSGVPSGWRTYLIGGMGVGGACRNKGTACSPLTDCVQTPVDGVGYSSYFAIDVTNPTTPDLKWEFSDPELGFTTTGPAIVRINAKTGATDDSTRNGRWFAVFASGPTGPINRIYHQFMGTSFQRLKIFVVDLNATAPLVKNTNYWVFDTGIDNAFAGSITNGASDPDRITSSNPGNYQDDMIYIGYTKKDTSTNTWTKGGVLRLVIDESYDPDTAPDSSTWKITHLIQDTGPVTTTVAKLHDKGNGKYWVYFGTGRYFYNQDDLATNQRMYGIADPCYKREIISGGLVVSRDDLDPSCSDAVSLADLKNTDGFGGGDDGWYIPLDAAVDTGDITTSFGAERIVTDPVALLNGVVFFTSFIPTSDPCGYGGQTYIWAVDYTNGEALAAGVLQGKALVQVSTGEFRQIDLETAFTGRGNRRLGGAISGKPSTDAPPIVSNAGLLPKKTILHVKER
jgi:type IV pilus assembly protein PilY1